MKSTQLVGRGALHAVGIMAYCALIAQIMHNGDRLFGHKDTAFTGVAFLMLFTLSATIVGVLMFGKPVLLYAEAKKQEAVQLVGYTVGALAVLTLLVLVTLAVLQ